MGDGKQRWIGLVGGFVLIGAVVAAGCGEQPTEVSSSSAAGGAVAPTTGAPATPTTLVSPMAVTCQDHLAAPAAAQRAAVTGYASSLHLPGGTDPTLPDRLLAACQADPTATVGAVLRTMLCPASTAPTAAAGGVSSTEAPLGDSSWDGADQPVVARVAVPARAGGGSGGGKSSGGSSSGGSSSGSKGGSNSGGSSSGGSSSGGSSSGGSSSGGSSSGGSNSSTPTTPPTTINGCA